MIHENVAIYLTWSAALNVVQAMIVAGLTVAVMMRRGSQKEGR